MGCTVLRVVVVALAFAFAASAAVGRWEANTDRPGSDYRRVEMGAPRPEVCRDACWAEPECRAFTYARPGALGPRALCFLKNAVPPARPADCCLSGVK